MGDLYKLSMEMEVLRESYARLIADLDLLLDKRKYQDNELCPKLLREVQKRYDEIMGIKTFEEAYEMIGVLKMVRTIVDEELANDELHG